MNIFFKLHFADHDWKYSAMVAFGYNFEKPLYSLFLY